MARKQSHLTKPPQAVGVLDVRSIQTKDTEQFDAVAQVVVLDQHRARHDKDHLSLHGVRLRARNFIDGYKLNLEDSEFKQFAAQHTIHGHTATLITKNLVLTTAHSIIPNELGATYFIFGRHAGAFTEPEADSGWFTVNRTSSTQTTQWVKARAIRAMVQPRRDRATPDWVIIELAEDVQGIDPIALAPQNTAFPVEDPARIKVVSHPLGLPRKVSEANAVPVPGPAHGEPRLFTDFASGGSGSPILVDGKVWAVISGAARFHHTDSEEAAHTQGPKRRIIKLEPKPIGDAKPQPFTTLDAIRHSLTTLTK